jgi:hypothetical protein
VLGQSQRILCVTKKKKALHLCKALSLLAPRPGLEPGTYGLTENMAVENSFKINDLQLIFMYV